MGQDVDIEGQPVKIKGPSPDVLDQMIREEKTSWPNFGFFGCTPNWGETFSGQSDQCKEGSEAKAKAALEAGRKAEASSSSSSEDKSKTDEKGGKKKESSEEGGSKAEGKSKTDEKGGKKGGKSGEEEGEEGEGS